MYFCAFGDKIEQNCKQTIRLDQYINIYIFENYRKKSIIH